MLKIYRSNSEDRLVDALSRILSAEPCLPTETEWLCVPSSPVRAWLSQQLAVRLGIFAGAKYLFPRELTQLLITRLLGERAQQLLNYNEEILSFAIFALLPELALRPECVQLRRYLDQEQSGLKRFKLSQKIAKVFDAYSIYRPEMLLQFEGQTNRYDESGAGDWQAVLFRAIVGQLGPGHLARQAIEFINRIEREGDPGGMLPKRISLVCISHLPPLFLQILNAVGRHIDVHLLITTPSREFFGHTRSGRKAGMPGATKPAQETRGSLKPAEIQLPAESFPDLGHPLLSSMGRLARDFQQSIEEFTTYHESDNDLYLDPVDSGGFSLLKQIQSDVFHLVHRRPQGHGDGSPLPVAGNDSSIAIHSCHSPLRELEVIRDQVLALCDDTNLELTPEDVLIMAPDIHDYFPFIESVFAGEAGGAPAIPFSICDLSPRQNSQVIGAFFKLLNFQESRATLEEVFDILRIPPVREKAGLSEQDVDRALTWSLEAGIRWGIDERHRQRHGQPGFVENTWKFGLERLLAGYAMPEEELQLFGRVLPFDDIEGQEAEILGKFAAFLDTLFRVAKELTVPQTLGLWRETLISLTEQLIAVSQHTFSDHQALLDALGGLDSIGKTCNIEEPIHLKVIREFLASKFETTRASRGFLSGGVTFSSLKPMRNVPFKVICLLGLNQQQFPRVKRALEFDKMAAKTRLGDRSPGLDDRHLFLQALLSAKESLIITYIGQSNQDGSVMEPSQLVLELLDTLESGFYLKERPRRRGEGSDKGSALKKLLITEHPLSPFSPQYYGMSSNPRLFSYSRGGRLGATALLSTPLPLRPFLRDPLALDLEEKRLLALEDLLQFIGSPSRYFVRHRLGIQLETENAHAPEREPVEPAALDRYSLGTRLLTERLAGRDWDTLKGYCGAAGILPLGQLGSAYFDEISEEVDSLVQVIAERAGTSSPKTLDLNIALESGATTTLLGGRISHIWPHARLEYRFGKITPKSLLQLWIRHVFMHLSREEWLPAPSILIGREDQNTAKVATLLPKIASLRPIDHDPSDYLRDLVDIFWQGQTEPLCFFPDASFVFAETLCNQPDKTDLQKAILRAERSWKSSFERISPAVRLLHGHSNPLAEGPEKGDQSRSFAELSQRIFKPLFDFLELS